MRFLHENGIEVIGPDTYTNPAPFMEGHHHSWHQTHHHGIPYAIPIPRSDFREPRTPFPGEVPDEEEDGGVLGPENWDLWFGHK
jgi:hypothetical protein